MIGCRREMSADNRRRADLACQAKPIRQRFHVGGRFSGQKNVPSTSTMSS
jgi:hypothetical protein